MATHLQSVGLKQTILGQNILILLMFCHKVHYVSLQVELGVLYLQACLKSRPVSSAVLLGGRQPERSPAVLTP